MSDRVVSYDEVRAGMEAFGEKPIAFMVAYARLTESVTAGLFLSQAVFWTTTYGREHDGWFYKPQHEWTETTMLSRREQESARKKLKQLKFEGQKVYEEKLQGLPATVHYRVNLTLLFRLLAADRIARNEQTGGIQYGGNEQTTSYNGEQTTSSETSEQSGRKAPDIKEREQESDKETEKESSVSGETGDALDVPIEVAFVETARHSMAEAGFTPDGTPMAPIRPEYQKVLDVDPSEIKVQPEPPVKPEPIKPEPVASGRSRGYAMAAMFFKAKGLTRKDIHKKTWESAATTFEGMPEAYDDEDVLACTKYLGTTWKHREPGSLKPFHVVDALPDWVNRGRPESEVPSGSSKRAWEKGKPDHDYWMQQAREMGD